MRLRESRSRQAIQPTSIDKSPLQIFLVDRIDESATKARQKRDESATTRGGGALVSAWI